MNKFKLIGNGWHCGTYFSFEEAMFDGNEFEEAYIIDIETDECVAEKDNYGNWIFF